MEPELTTIRRTTIPGGDFTAVQEVDGSWTVKAVPILAEMEIGRRSNKVKIDQAWMLAAIRSHRLLERDNRHVASVHELHHDPGVQPRQIGFLRLSHVGKMMLKGELQDVLYADICGVEEYDLDGMAQLRLPYRSIEIPKDWRPEISSLALMSTESPEHKLPMLRVTKKIRNPEAPTESELVALRGDDDSNHLLWSYPMPKNKTDDKSEKLNKESQDKLADNGDEEMEEGEGGDDLVSKITAIVEKSITEKLPKAIEAALESAMPGAGMDSAEEKTYEDEPPAEAQSEDTEEDAMSEENAKLRGRIAALEKKDRDRDEKATRKDVVDAGLEKLRGSGRSVDDKVRSELDSLAENAKDPKKAVDTFVDSYLRSVPEDPPEDVEHLGERGLLTGDESVDDLPDVVQKYRAQGPDALSLAASKGREFDALRESGMNLSSSRDEFVNMEMELAGFKPAE